MIQFKVGYIADGEYCTVIIQLEERDYTAAFGEAIETATKDRFIRVGQIIEIKRKEAP